MDEDKFKAPDVSQASKERNINHDLLNDYVAESKSRFVYAQQTGDISVLENLAEEQKFTAEFADQRGMAEKIRDFTLQIIAGLKKQKIVVQSGKQQVISKYKNQLQDQQEDFKQDRKIYLSVKDDIDKHINEYMSETHYLAKDVAGLQNELSKKKEVFTDDVVELVKGYLQGTYTVEDLEKEKIKTDASTLQAYSIGIEETMLLETQIEAKNNLLQTKISDYTLALNNRSEILVNLSILEMQEFCTKAQINQLDVDSKICSRPSLVSTIAKSRIVAGRVQDLQGKLENEDAQKINQYNKTIEQIGSYSDMRKSYAQNQKKKPKIRL